MRLLPQDSEHGWTPYLWLFYLSFYVASPFLFGGPAWAWLAQGAGLAAFLALYFRGYWVDGSARLPIITGIASLGVLLTWLNAGALSFFIYAAAFVGGARTGRRAAFWIAGISAAGVATSIAVEGLRPTGLGLVPMIAPMATVTPLIGFVNLHYASIRRRDAALRLAEDEVARLAAATERHRIAGDLHDLLGHTLSVIVLKAELASKLVARDTPRAAAEIAEVERISREALAEVRRVVHGFTSARLGDELTRARAVLASAGVAVTVATPPAGGLLPPGTPAVVEHALALVCREAVTNVLRHAHATTCHISVSTDADHIALEVEDDGVGGELVEGHGLQGMRARLMEIGGSLERDGRRGMRLRASAPRAAAVEAQA
ncbi:MAG: sensor histidine kinase [Vicinamibacterales bacterium]